MCKVGTNLWTKQQSTSKQQKSKLLDDVANQKVDPKDLLIRLDEIENARNIISLVNKPKGSANMPQASSIASNRTK